MKPFQGSNRDEITDPVNAQFLQTATEIFDLFIHPALVSQQSDIATCIDAQLPIVFSLLQQDHKKLLEHPFPAPGRLQAAVFNGSGPGEATRWGFYCHWDNDAREPKRKISNREKFIRPELIHVVQKRLLFPCREYALPHWFAEGMAACLAGQGIFRQLNGKDGLSAFLNKMATIQGSKERFLFLRDSNH